MLFLLPPLMTLLTGCASILSPKNTGQRTEAKSGYTITRNLIYTPAGWPEKIPADLFQPTGLFRPAPAVLLIHGGGWTGSDGRWQMEPIARQLVKRGYVVLNVAYRLAPKYTFPAPVDDMQQALKWMLAHAAEKGVDATRIAAYGYSAGGYLADFVGLTGPDSRRIRAIVAGGAPTDLTFYAGGDLVPQFLGGHLKDIPQRFKEASPVNYVTDNSPPMFLYHGTADNLVRLEHPRAMIHELEKHHIHYETYWIEDRDHIPAFLLPANSVNQAIDFLDKQLGVR